MANRFWVGGAGNWNDSGHIHWAATSGGAGGQAVPLASDDVFFDGNSGTALVTVTGSSVCRSLDCTGYTGTLTGGSAFSIGDASGGSFKLNSSMTYAITGGLNFVSTSNNGGSGWSITTGGQTLANVTCNGTGGKWVLQDGLISTGIVTLTIGTLDTNGQTLNISSFVSSSSNVRTLTLSSSAITCTLAGTAWNCQTSTNLTLNAGTSSITLNGAGASFFGGNNGNPLYNTINLTGSGVASCALNTGSVNNLNRTGTAAPADALSIGNATINTSLTLAGNFATNRLLVESSTVGSLRTLTCNGTITASYVDFMDIGGAGSASWNLAAITGGSGDAGGNSGITFTAPVNQHWISSSGGNWSDVANWTSRIPLSQDNVFIDAVFISAQTVTTDMARLGATIDWSGATWAGTAPKMAGAISTKSAWYGSLILVSGMSIQSVAGNIWEARGRGTFDIDNKGISIGVGLTVTAPGGTYNLRSSYTQNNGAGISAGTYKTNGFDVSVLNSWSVTGTANIDFSTSTFSFSHATVVTILNISTTGKVTADQATFVISNARTTDRTFAGGGNTFGTLSYTTPGSTGGLTITGSSSFGTINFSDISNARALTFTAGTSNVVGVRNIFGTSGKLMSVNSSSVGTPATLISRGSWNIGANSTLVSGNSGLTVAASAEMDFLSVQDITAATTSTGGFFQVL